MTQKEREASLISLAYYSLIVNCPHCRYGLVVDGPHLRNSYKTSTKGKIVCPDCKKKYVIPKINVEIVYDSHSQTKEPEDIVDDTCKLLCSIGYKDKDIRGIVEDCYIEGCDGEELIKKSIARIE